MLCSDVDLVRPYNVYRFYCYSCEQNIYSVSICVYDEEEEHFLYGCCVSMSLILCYIKRKFTHDTWCA